MLSSVCDFVNEVDMDLSIYFYTQNVQADQTIGETNNYCYTRTNFEMTATFKGTSNIEKGQHKGRTPFNTSQREPRHLTNS